MSPRRFIAAALLGLAACGSTPTVATRGPVVTPTAPAPATAAAPAEDTPYALWPKLKRGQLPNRLTYYILEHRRPEKRAFLWLAVNAGSVQEDDDQRGLAHFVEHMAFNGTTHFPKAQLIDYLEKVGMGSGADLNAYTSFDETVYQLKVPSEDPAVIAKGLDILRDWSSNLTFDSSEVDKERGVVLEEWRLGRGAFERIFDKQAEELFKGSRYAARLTIGLPDTLKHAPRDALVRFYKDWYQPQHMAVIAVGDFDAAAMEQQIIARFGDLEKAAAGARPRLRGEVPTADGTRVSIETDRELPGQQVSVFNLVPHRPESTPGDYRRIVVEQVYQAIISERLATLARRKETPFGAAGAGATGMTREIDAFARYAQVKGGKVEDALRSLFVEVLRVERHGFTQAELDRARSNIARFSDQMAVEEATRDSSEYTSEITRHFFEGELIIGRVAERDQTVALLPTVTLAELNSLAKSYGGADNRVITIAGPEGKPLPSKERVLAVIAEVEKSDIDAWQDQAAATALMAEPPRPGKIVKETRIPSVGVTEWKLSNGARVIVKPTDFETDSVEITANSPGGLAMASAKQLREARLAENLVEVGGAGTLDLDALGKVLAGKQVSVSTSIDEVSEGLDARGSVRDLETMMQLLYLRVTAPRLDQAAVATYRAGAAEQLAEQLRVPEVQFAQQSQAVLWKGNPRKKPLTAADVEQVDAGKALAFFKDRFGDSSDFTFVIVGAVDPAKLAPLVETYLASLPAKGRVEQEKDSAVRRASGVVKKSWFLGQEPKARVLLQFHGPEKWSRDKDRDLYILGQVLSIRLREVLREDLGGVYGVGARGGISRSPYQERTFTIEFGCDPTRVDELLQAARAEIAAIEKNGIGADYLEKVKQQFVRLRETQLRQNQFWAGWLDSAYRFGDDPSLILDTAPMVARVTSDNVKAAARRYLDQRQFFQAIMLPAKK